MYLVTIKSYLGNEFQVLCDEYSVDPYTGVTLTLDSFFEFNLGGISESVKFKEFKTKSYVCVDTILSVWDTVYNNLTWDREDYLRQHGFLRSYEL